MTARIGARFFVAGRVQGVSFRAATREQALRLGLSGHAKNLRDGRVEVVACGDEAAIEALARWLRQGPPSARVDALIRETAARVLPAGGFAVLQEP